VLKVLLNSYQPLCIAVGHFVASLMLEQDFIHAFSIAQPMAAGLFFQMLTLNISSNASSVLLLP